MGGKPFSALVDEQGIGVNERFVEITMAYCYQNIYMDTEDLVTVGSISDIGNRYLLLSDLGFRALLSLLCAKQKQKVFSQLEVWRSAIRDDISDDMKGLWNTNRKLPDSEVYLQQRR